MNKLLKHKAITTLKLLGFGTDQVDKVIEEIKDPEFDKFVDGNNINKVTEKVIELAITKIANGESSEINRNFDKAVQIQTMIDSLKEEQSKLIAGVETNGIDANTSSFISKDGKEHYEKLKKPILIKTIYEADGTSGISIISKTDEAYEEKLSTFEMLASGEYLIERRKTNFIEATWQKELSRSIVEISKGLNKEGTLQDAVHLLLNKNLVEIDVTALNEKALAKLEAPSSIDKEVHSLLDKVISEQDSLVNEISDLITDDKPSLEALELANKEDIKLGQFSALNDIKDQLESILGIEKERVISFEDVKKANSRVINTLKVVSDSANKRNKTIDNLFLYGPKNETDQILEFVLNNQKINSTTINAEELTSPLDIDIALGTSFNQTLVVKNIDKASTHLQDALARRIVRESASVFMTASEKRLLPTLSDQMGIMCKVLPVEQAISKNETKAEKRANALAQAKEHLNKAEKVSQKKEGLLP